MMFGSARAVVFSGSLMRALPVLHSCVGLMSEFDGDTTALHAGICLDVSLRSTHGKLLLLRHDIGTQLTRGGSLIARV